MTVEFPRPDVDPGGLEEFSVVFTDRSLNSMSQAFQGIMRQLSAGLKEVYRASEVVIVPGGGTFGMEAVARQFGAGTHALIVRNGWFSFRWTQIFDASGVASATTVCKARQTGNDSRLPFRPAPIEEVTAAIRTGKPGLVFAPHVETSAGMILPDDYITALADAAHDVGALMVLDCIASGCCWVDMEATGVDILLSAPQKGWSSTPCAGLVMLSKRAALRMAETTSTSFAMDLAKWHAIMKAYEDGGHAYHATMPTDGLREFHKAFEETRAFGFDTAHAAQVELGQKVRAMLAERGIASIAAPEFAAPSVVVSYTDDPDFKSGKAFALTGTQVAAGVPLQVDEPADFQTFRIGLFGLDKLRDVDATVARLSAALDWATGG